MTTERTPIGDQYVIPGAERVTDRAIAERRGNQSLRPSRPQAPCNIGLFGDAPAQVDLVDYINQTARK